MYPTLSFTVIYVLAFALMGYGCIFVENKNNKNTVKKATIIFLAGFVLSVLILIWVAISCPSLPM